MDNSTPSPNTGQTINQSPSMPLLTLVQWGVLLRGIPPPPWGIPIQPLDRPIWVVTLDGQLAGAGSITQQLTLPHVEKLVLYLTCIPQLHLVLGSPWLVQHNLIDWVTWSLVAWVYSARGCV